MARTQQQAIAQIQQVFAFYGFTACPLTDAEILACLGDYSDDEIYSIGCDVAAGFSLIEARQALETE